MIVSLHSSIELNMFVMIDHNPEIRVCQITIPEEKKTISSASDVIMMMTVLVFSAVNSYSALHSKAHNDTNNSLYSCTHTYAPFFISIICIKDRQKSVGQILTH
jgi:hypothetical protein